MLKRMTLYEHSCKKLVSIYMFLCWSELQNISSQQSNAILKYRFKVKYVFLILSNYSLVKWKVNFGFHFRPYPWNVTK